MNTQGLARVDININDISVLINTGLKGIHAFLGETERGELGKTVLVGSFSEYRKHFGGLLATSTFPLICKRALDAGAQLRIARVGGYADPTDASTATGANANAAVGPAGDTAGIDATSPGEWGNALRVETRNPVSLEAGRVDVHIYIDGVEEGAIRDYEVVANVNSVITAADVQSLNAASILVEFSSDWVGKDISALITVGSPAVILANGVNVGTPAIIDLIGDSSAGTGIHSFDNDTDFVKISVPNSAVAEVDTALAAYAELRKDCRAILRTPTGISGATAVEYRNKTGAFAGMGNPVNTWFASMIFGGNEVLNPQTGGQTTLTFLPDVAARYTNKDTTAYEWFSAAGPKRGRIPNAGVVEYNVGTAARSLEADNLVNQGINPVIDDVDYGVTYWGNRTLQRAATLLQKDNVADLIIFLVRAVAPLAKSELFEPNDIRTWKAIHRKVSPLLRSVVRRRGAHNIFYVGDQEIDRIEDATVNTPANIDQGKYCFNLIIQPTVALEYIGITLSVSNSGVTLEQILNEQN